MRLLFTRSAPSTHLPDPALPFQTGLPQSAASTLGAHEEVFGLTGNKGNMIHRMGTVQSLKCDRRKSSQANIARMHKRLGKSSFQEALRKNFDAVVLTMSNALRKGESDGPMLEAIRDINVPLFVVGLGLQNNLKNGLDDLSPQMRELTQLLGSKAKFLGVRGHRTRKWLEANGISNATAIGCPSMFTYPLNVANLTPPQKTEKIMVAGHLGQNLLLSKSDRAIAFARQFTGYHCSYVFQDELRSYGLAVSEPGLYDEATSRLDAETISSHLSKHLGFAPPFTNFYSFNDVSAWRQAALRYDLYIGDRIHGGVAAMQAGVPALILYNDDRVAELTSFHGIPSCSIKEFLKLGVEKSINHHMNADRFLAFNERYRQTARNYIRRLSAVGLALEQKQELELVAENK